MANPYATLEVQKNASEAEIKSAYRKLAKKLHPDHNKDNPTAAARFAKASQAYTLLSDKAKRRQFDRGEIDVEGNAVMSFGSGPHDFSRQGQNGERGFARSGRRGQAGVGRESLNRDGVDLSELFSDIFGGGSGATVNQARGANPKARRPQPRPAKRSNISYKLTVPFVDAARRVAQRLTLKDGTVLDLKLPTGIENGMQMRLAGRGQAGGGGGGGSGNVGDALVTLHIDPHEFFTRDGDDIRLDLPINLKEAVLGAKIKVPTVDGPVLLSIPAGVTSGKILRLKGKGFSHKNGGTGDQLVRLMIDVPAKDEALTHFVISWDDSRNLRTSLGG